FLYRDLTWPTIGSSSYAVSSAGQQPSLVRKERVASSERQNVTDVSKVDANNPEVHNTANEVCESERARWTNNLVYCRMPLSAHYTIPKACSTYGGGTSSSSTPSIRCQYPKLL
ncbi:unnamed protein product, partial [Choristocarpus tenellus]